MCALSKLDEFLLNPQFRTCSVVVQGASGNNDSENWEPTGDRSIGDLCPKVVFSTYHSSNSNVSEQEETHHMMTGVQEEIPYCSLVTSSGEQKKTRSTSLPQFGNENTLSTIEADQILLAFQQLVTNSNSANFDNNNNRILKLPKSPTTTTPTFDRKSEKLQLFEDLFQTSLKSHNQLTEEDKTNYFHSLLRGLCSVKNTRNHSQCYNRTQFSTTGLQPSEPEVK